MSAQGVQKNEEPWEPFRYFIGRWVGQASGRPGTGRLERTYELILQDRFIRVYNRSVYEPQERNPDGEIHEDLGLFSYDKARDVFILREFHVEGFVNQYVVSSWDREKGVLVMETEAIENIPPGWRARTTYEILGDDEFKETFDLARPGKEWACYITNVLTRAPHSPITSRLPSE